MTTSDETRWCTACKLHREVSAFSGANTRCKKCSAEAAAKSRSKAPGSVRYGEVVRHLRAVMDTPGSVPAELVPAYAAVIAHEESLSSAATRAHRSASMTAARAQGEWLVDKR